VTEKVGGIGVKFEEVSRTLTTFVQAFEVRVANTDERMVKLSETIGKLEDSVSSLTTAMGEADNSSKSLVELANVAEIHKLELEANLSASREALNSLHQEFLGAAQLVTRKLGNS
jgi:chromosome segregation ATPase